MADAANIRPRSDEQVIDADFVKSTFLHGVNLKTDDGVDLPDEAIDFYIQSATRWVERELNVIILPTSISSESHDYYWDDYANFAFVKLLNFPVRSVSKVAIRFPLTTELLAFDDEWYRIESVAGQVNLIPTQGSFSAILIGQGGSFLPLLYSGRDYVPHIIQVDYEAGFKDGEIPEDILHLIGMKASIGPLNIAGDLIAGAGIASKSVSLDGLSESLGTTSSATNAGYGARIIQYEKQIKETVSLLRRNYKGIEMVVA